MDTPPQDQDEQKIAESVKQKEAMQKELEKQDTVQTAKDAHAGLIGKRILWVEDDKFLGNIVSKRMGEYKCEMVLAKNGDEAFAYFAKQKELPHIIVLDLILPGMSGFDILKKIRDDVNLASIPVMILSNLNQSADIERAKILGAQKFVVKASASLDEIIKNVESLLVAGK